ncbi:hypothetical protein BH11ARM2_BH11ARM2_26200 [soil metagenome]
MAYDPNLDEKLASPAQNAVRHAVHDLPEDTPNMAWRATLSDRIAKEGRRAHRRRWFLNVGRPVIGLALTASLAMVLVLRGTVPEPRQVSSRSLEAVLVRAHKESQIAFDVGGVGFGNDPIEVTSASNTLWDESDVEAF